MSDRSPPAEPALLLRIDGEALVANWRWFAARAGVEAAAAVKADGYGLGAAAVVARLAAAGCRTFCVATWAEALALAPLDADLLVLHGFVPADAGAARHLPRARPLLSTPLQVAAWRSAFGRRPADLMVDTGMNRLGLALSDIGAAADLVVDTVHSHLACADEPGHPLTARQLARFHEVVAATAGARHALANSAGVCLGRDFAFDFVRVGLGLYGGVPHPEAAVRAVVRPEARVVQVRNVAAGDSVGYGATWVADRASRIAIVNLGYADGLPRILAPALRFVAGGALLPAVGRTSMDLIAVDATQADIAEGDWLALDFDLPRLAATGGMSQYELLTGLSRRYGRIWS